MARSFSHLLGLGRPAAAADDESEKPKDDGKVKKGKKAKAEEAPVDDIAEEKTDEAEDAVADPDEDPGDEEDEEQDTAPKAGKRGKKARAEDDDADGDEMDAEDEKDPKCAAARGRERARCAAIFDSPAAAHNIVGAAHLAFGASMPRSQAIHMLAALGTAAPKRATGPRGDTLRDRMAQVQTPALGSDAEQPKGAVALAAQIVLAGKKRRGEI